MKSEKVKEIKKALEQNDDNGIMYEVNDQKRTCKFIHHKDILTLINELESENAELTNAVLDNLDAYRDGFSEGASLKDRVDNKLKNENQQLKDRIAELEKENAKWIKEVEDRKAEVLHLQEYGKKLIRETELKQFAEKLIEKKVKLGDRFNIYDIDETLKECLCDKYQ